MPTALRLDSYYSQGLQLLPNFGECKASTRACQHSMRALYVSIMLHQRERHWLIRKDCDWAAALTVMPSDIEFIDGEIAENVLSGKDSFVGMTL